jgi:hypothetical protein
MHGRTSHRIILYLYTANEELFRLQFILDKFMFYFLKNNNNNKIKRRIKFSSQPSENNFFQFSLLNWSKYM